MNQYWRLCAIDYDEDGLLYEYFPAAVMGRGLLFIVSQVAVSLLLPRRFQSMPIGH